MSEAGAARADGAIPYVEGLDLMKTERKELNGILLENTGVYSSINPANRSVRYAKTRIKIPSHQRPILQRPYKMGAKQKQILETMVTK